MAERKSITDRFWSKVDKNGPSPAHMPHLGPCWVWTASTGKKGYGKFSFGNGWALAHRWVWGRYVAPIPDGLFVLHHCDTPGCVRPDHLFLGDAVVNARDMAAKGRSGAVAGDHHWTRRIPERAARGSSNGARMHPETRARGEHNGAAVLTESLVRSIRRCYEAGEPQSVIADRLGIGRSTVNHLVHRRSWKHVT